MSNPKKIFITFIIFLIPLLISFRLFRPGYFSMQDDMHVFRLQQFDQCLKDLQIPCRQISDGGLGYGYPLFNFYSPLPYAAAEIFHLLGFSFIDSLKITFTLPNFIRSIGMYLLAGSFFGPVGGLISSVFYTLAPYQAVNGFVRGALAELWALSFLPLITYSLYKSKTNLFILTLSALFLSHNLTTMYFLPVIFIFSYLNKKVVFLIKNSLFSFLIAGFFLIPAFFEKNLTTVDTMTQGYFSYIIHFVTLKQLFFSNFWGYGASQWGPIDGLSFQIGYLHWLIPLAVIVFQFLRKQFPKNILFFFLVGLFALFLTHNRSTFLWNNLRLLQFYQFPWRFLGLAVFCFSFISGNITALIPRRFLLVFTFFLILTVVIINLPYFREDIWYQNLTDAQKLSPAEVVRQSGAGLKDYWTKSSALFPQEFAPLLPIAVNGQIQNIQYHKTSKSLQGQIFITSPSAVIIFPQAYFPQWKLYLNGRISNYQIDPKLGQLQISLPKGDYYYTFRFSDTPIRTIANILSVFGITLYIIKLISEKKS